MTKLNDKYENLKVGNYVIANNNYNGNKQVLEVYDGHNSNRFDVISTDHNKPLNGAPAAYPHIYMGMHYGNESNNNPFPKQIKRINKLKSTWGFSMPGDSIFNAAYDVWIDSDKNEKYKNQVELMIWLNYHGNIQPLGSHIRNVNINGYSFQLWHGDNVTTYRIMSKKTSINNLDILEFINDMDNRGYCNGNQYVTSVQAGFEIWSDGVGLKSNFFGVYL